MMKSAINRPQKWTITVFVLMFVVYVLYPNLAYWLGFDQNMVRLSFLIYSIFTAGIFYLLVKDKFKKEMKLLDILRPEDKGSKVFAIFLLLLLIFGSYSNSIITTSDEYFHISRGGIGALHIADIFIDVPIPDYASSSWVFNRYPPLAMLISTFFLLIFGGIGALFRLLIPGLSDCSGLVGCFYIDELTARFPSIIFSILLFFTIYKIVRLYYDKRVSLLASASLVLSPPFLLLAFTAHLSAGLMFFSAMACYLGLKYIKSRDFSYLAVAALFITLGTFYKRPTVLVAGVVAASSMLLLKDKKKALIDAVKFTIICLLLMSPFLLLDKTSPTIVPKADASISLENFSNYLGVMGLQFTIPIALLALFSLFYSARKNALTILCTLWFLLWYGLMSLYNAQAIRLTVPYSTPIFILVAITVFDLSSKFKKKQDIFKVVSMIMVAFLFAESMYFFLAGSYLIENDVSRTGDFARLQPLTLRYNKLPYANLMTYLKENLEERDKVYSPLYPVLEFYSRKHSLRGDHIHRFSYAEWQAIDFDIEKFYEICKEKNINFVVLPKDKEMVANTRGPELAEMIIESENFRLVEEFAFDKRGVLYPDNRLLLFRRA